MSDPAPHQPTAAPLSGSAVTAIALAVVGAILAVFMAPFLKIVGLLMVIAAAIVGAAAAVNARRAGTPTWLPWSAVAIAVATGAYLLIWQVA